MVKFIIFGLYLNFFSFLLIKFIKEFNLDVDISYEYSIDSVFKVFLGVDYLVLFIENVIDGYI